MEPQERRATSALAVPLTAMLRASLAVCIPVAVLATVVAGVLRGAHGAASALLAGVLITAFFAASLVLLRTLVAINPLFLFAGAVSIYFTQVAILAAAFFYLGGQVWMDGLAFAVAAGVVILAWQVCQIAVVVRLRQPVYDDRAGADPSRPVSPAPCCVPETEENP